MVSRLHAIEYILYVIEHPVHDFFTQHNIHIDKTFSDRVPHVMHLFNKIKDIYKNDEGTIRQFVISLQEALLKEESPPFTGYPITFMQFYSLILYLVTNLSSRAHIIDTLRRDTITQALQLPVIDNVVYKYDYHFMGKLKYSLGDKSLTMSVLSPDTLITGSLQVWNYKTGHLVHTLKDIGSIRIIRIHNNLIVGGGDSAAIRVWDASTFEAKKSIIINNVITDFLVVKNVLLTKRHGTVQLWNIYIGEHIHDLVNPSFDVLFMYVYQHDKIVVGYDNGKIIIWNIHTFEQNKIIDTRSYRMNCGLIIKDKILLGFARGILKIFNLTTGQLHSFIDIQSAQAIVGLAVSPYDCDRLVITLGHGILYVTNLHTGLKEFQAKIPDPVGYDEIPIAFLPDGSIVSCNKEGNIYTWNKGMKSFKIDDSEIIRLLTLPNGSLASSSMDGVIKIWV